MCEYNSEGPCELAYLHNDHTGAHAVSYQTHHMRLKSPRSQADMECPQQSVCVEKG